MRECALQEVRSLPWGRGITDKLLNDQLRELVRTLEGQAQRESQLAARASAAAAAAPGDNAEAREAGADQGRPAAPAGAGVARAALSDNMQPPAFRASRKRREELTARVQAAQFRLRSTLGAASAAAAPAQEEGSGGDGDGNARKRRRTLHGAAQPTAWEGGAPRDAPLEAEDFAVERQLLAGVSPEDIIAGSTEGRATGHPGSRVPGARAAGGAAASASRELGPSDIADGDLQPGGQYLRSEREIALLKQFAC